MIFKQNKKYFGNPKEKNQLNLELHRSLSFFSPCINTTIYNTIYWHSSSYETLIMKPKLDYNGSKNHLPKIAKNGIKTTQKNFHASVDMQCLRLARSFCRWMTYYFLLQKESQTALFIVVADFGCFTIPFSTLLTTMGLKEGC